jgi:hypothetical protein
VKKDFAKPFYRRLKPTAQFQNGFRGGENYSEYPSQQNITREESKFDAPARN